MPDRQQMLTPERKTDAAATLGIGAASVAIVLGCCAALPAIAALVGGLTLGVTLGLGLGAVILGALAWTAATMLGRRRQHARCRERSRR